jgi:hypothetical protein
VAALKARSQKLHDEPSCLLDGSLNPPICFDRNGSQSAKCELLIAFPLAPQLFWRDFTFARENNVVLSVNDKL